MTEKRLPASTCRAYTPSRHPEWSALPKKDGPGNLGGQPKVPFSGAGVPRRGDAVEASDAIGRADRSPDNEVLSTA
jgi:hypothetical protein